MSVEPVKMSGTERMRRRLMDAARLEFGEKGLEAATTRGIADRAGCNEVTLFRHFENKRKLLEEVVRDTSGEFGCLCECGCDFSGDLRADLERFARVYNDSFERCEGMARALIGEGRRQPMLAKELIGDVLAPFHQSLANCLSQAAQAGAVRNSLDGMAFAEIFTSALMGGVLRRTSGLSSLNREKWTQEIVEIFVSGVLNDTSKNQSGDQTPCRPS